MIPQERFTLVCRKCDRTFRSRRPLARLCTLCKKVNRVRDNRIGQGPKSYKKKHKPKHKPLIDARQAQLLDREQRRFDLELDIRLHAGCASSPGRVIRPGDPEFEEVARTVTPPRRHAQSFALSMTTPPGGWYLENGGFPVR